MAMPPVPMRLQIVLAVQTFLRGIQGTAAGYFHTVRSDSVTTKMDANLWLLPYSALPYFVVMPSTPESDRYDPSRVLLIEFPILIVGRMDADPEVTGAEKLTTWERLFADIERALTHHPTTRAVDVTLGGLVTDIRITDRQAGIDVGASPQVHVRVSATARYRRYYGEA